MFKWQPIFHQNINAADRNGIGNKLRTYALFKKSTNWRLPWSTHWKRSLHFASTPAHLRMYKVCNLHVEDEIHLFTKGEGHKQERVILYQNIILLYPHFKNLSETDKFIFIMMSEDVHVIYVLSIFLVKSNQLRKYLLSQAQNQANWMVWDAVLPCG